MILKGRFKVIYKKKRTKAKLFANLEAGDVIEITKTLCDERPGCGITQASFCDIKNEKTGETVRKSFAELNNILILFELEEL